MNIVTGQFDLKTSTPGTVNWVERLVESKWDDIDDSDAGTDPKRGVINLENRLRGYFQKRKQLTLFTVLRAGHDLITENKLAMEWILKKIIQNV